MPPRKRTVSNMPMIDAETGEDVNPNNQHAVAPQPGLLKLGALVNLVSGGRTLENYEVIDFDAHFVKFRGNITIAPQTELVLIPWSKIEALGLRDER